MASLRAALTIRSASLLSLIHISEPAQLEKLIVELEEEMLAAAEELRFEQAARIRDELKELRRDLEAMRA